MIEKIKSNRLWHYTFFTAIILGLCTHLPIMLSDIPNHDGLASIYFDQNMTISGRWFLSIACGFSSYYALPWLIGVFSIIILAVTAVVLVEVLEIEKISGGVITAGLLVTFPVLTSTFAYVFTMDGYMLAVLLAVLSVYLVEKKKWGFVLGGIALAFSMGIYQAYLPIAMLLCLYKVMLLMISEKNAKDKVKSIFNYAYMGFVGVGLYYVIMKLSLWFDGSKLGEYQGGNQGASAMQGGVWEIYKDFFEFAVKGKVLVNNLYSIAALMIVVILCAGVFIHLCISRKWYRKGWIYVAVISFAVIIPVVSNAILLILPNVTYHTLMRYQYVILLMMAVAFIQKYTNNKITSVILCAAALVLIFNYVITDNIAYSNLEKKYEKTYAYCLRLADRMEQTEGYYQGIPIAMIGVISDEQYPVTDVTKDVTSKLLGITGDYLLYTSENYKAFFENYMGVTINLVPQEDMLDIYNSKEYWEMNSFPAKDSMQVVDGILYIKTENKEKDPYTEKKEE